jgi:hypothetical protein
VGREMGARWERSIEHAGDNDASRPEPRSRMLFPFRVSLKSFRVVARGLHRRHVLTILLLHEQAACVP